MRYLWIGFIDGFLFLVFWLSLLFLNFNWNPDAFFNPILSFVVIALIVAWRGIALTIKIENRVATLAVAIKEGAVFGGLIPITILFLVFSNCSFSADPPNEKCFNEPWQELVLVPATLILVGSFLGVVHSSVFYFLNRYLAKIR